MKHLMVIYNDGIRDHDAISLTKVEAATRDGKPFRTYATDLCEGIALPTEATAERIDATMVEIVWEDTEINKKTDVELGTMLLTWDKQADVFVKAPAHVRWAPNSGADFWIYPKFALLPD